MLNIVVGLVYFIINVFLCITVLCYSFYDQSIWPYVFLYLDYYDAVIVTGTHKSLLLLTTDNLLDALCETHSEVELQGKVHSLWCNIIVQHSWTFLNIIQWKLFLWHNTCCFHTSDNASICYYSTVFFCFICSIFYALIRFIKCVNSKQMDFNFMIYFYF
jgi:hypothetical protein